MFEASALFDYRTLDYFFAAFLIFLFPFLLLIGKNKFPLLTIRITFTNSVLILLIFVLLFAPIITNENPDFHKNIRLTKLLPPLSKVKIVNIVTDQNETESLIDEYVKSKNKIIKREFDETVLLCDSITIASEIKLHQKDYFIMLNKSQIEFSDTEPLVSTKYFLFGTDEFGRNIFTRIVFGTRISVLIGLASVALSMLIGILLGAVSGFSGGMPDRLISRITDMFLAFPMLILIVLVIGLFGSSIWSIIIVLGFSGWMSLYKIVKSELVSIKNKDYFLAAQMIGLNKTQLILKEVIPVIAAPIIVNVIFQFGNVILAESALSYLGLGIGNEFPSWGAMIQSGQSYISIAWWMIFFPSTILVGTLLTAKNIGEKLNKFLNPKLN
jgi:peptide/nickel transport system permease protein